VLLSEVENRFSFFFDAASTKIRRSEVLTEAVYRPHILSVLILCGDGVT